MGKARKRCSLHVASCVMCHCDTVWHHMVDQLCHRVHAWCTPNVDSVCNLPPYWPTQRQQWGPSLGCRHQASLHLRRGGVEVAGRHCRAAAHAVPVCPAAAEPLLRQDHGRGGVPAEHQRTRSVGTKLLSLMSLPFRLVKFLLRPQPKAYGSWFTGALKTFF